MTYLCGRCETGRTDIDHGLKCPLRGKEEWSVFPKDKMFMIALCTERGDDGGCDEHEAHLLDEDTNNWFYDVDAHQKGLAVTRNPSALVEDKPGIPWCKYDCSYMRNSDLSITILSKGERCTIEEHKEWEVVPYAG